MLEKEISETYYFNPDSFDERGRDTDGVTFREAIKDFERDFHARHTAEYALNLYGNSSTMRLLAKSCDAAPFLMYGMDLTQGRTFDAEKDPHINHEMDKHSKNIYVYGIDSTFMTEFDEYDYPIIDGEKRIFPLTLLIDDFMREGEVRLAVPTIDGDECEDVIIDVPHFKFA